MRHRRRVALVGAGLVSILAAAALAARDAIFPAEPAAQKAIHWENGYFVINGTPTFLASGEIHYARVPRELWRDRILRAKGMGLNTIQTYVMWNAHEGKEGVFDFTDNLDLDAWLTLVQDCGMYAVVRPGPYVCAEWENGGIPAWLCDKPGMKIRTDDAQYLKYVDAFESKVFAIIAKHQISKGGNVLMVQLENELTNTWGTDSNAYTQHLYTLARDCGLEVPLFNSGLHHGDDPAGNRPFPAHEMPWYSTEFWSGWIGLSGDMSQQKLEQKVRGTWKIIGFGGAGYDYYVVHGGTNFGYSKGSEVAASYDYAAPIGEAGQLRKAYFPMKRAAMFAGAFSDILTTSKDAANFVASVDGAGTNVSATARTSPLGSAIFLSDAPRFQQGRRGATAQPNPQFVQIKLADGRQIPTGDKTLRLDPGEIRPILTDFAVNTARKEAAAKPLVLDYAATAILTRKLIGNTTYVVCYGIAAGSGEIAIKGRKEPIAFTYPVGPQTTEIPIDGYDVNLLVVNSDLADRTWVTDDSLVVNADYASPEGAIYFDTTKGGSATVYSPKGKSLVASPDVKPLNGVPALAGWRVREGASEALVTTDTSMWPSSAEPKPMEQYDDYANGWGWYRTTIHRDAAEDVAMRFTGAGDDVRVFLNGQRIAGGKTGATLALKAGNNDLAVLCFNEGRPKMYNFTGATGLMAAKGLWGPVQMIDKTQASVNQQGWAFHAGLDALAETPLIARVTNWKDWLAGPWMAEPDHPRAANLPTFYRTDFLWELAGDKMITRTVALRTAGLKAGSVWLNGHNLGPYKGDTQMYLPECWLEKSNTLVIFDAEGASPEKATLQAIQTMVRVGS